MHAFKWLSKPKFIPPPPKKAVHDIKDVWGYKAETLACDDFRRRESRFPVNSPRGRGGKI